MKSDRYCCCILIFLHYFKNLHNKFEKSAEPFENEKVNLRHFAIFKELEKIDLPFTNELKNFQ